jgi:surfactin family lipopeptide synthetase C
MSMPDVEDIYELAPLQQGMLFHTLYAPESRMYLEQESYPLYGTIDVPALVRAWQQVIERHPVLRSSFHWEGLKKPVQVVHRQVQLPVDIQDWRRLSAREQEQRLDAYLRSDRERGFDLSKAPLLRISILERAEDFIQFMLTFHHMLLDGWSDRLITDEVWAFYDANCQGKDLRIAEPRPYGDFIAWLQRQDQHEAERFWRQMLKGFNAPTRLGIDRTAAGTQEADVEECKQSLYMSKQTTAALQYLARENRLTLNTLIQGAWAVVLSRYSGDSDVVFGTVVSGRPATLPGVEAMVGLFINTLPLRTQVPPDAFAVPWLKELQARQVEARDYEYSALVDIQGWSEVPAGVPLFESIVIFENYPVSGALEEDENPASEEDSYRCFQKTNYPLNLMVIPNARLTLTILYSRLRFADTAIVRVLGHLQMFLEGLAANPDRRLSALAILTPGERKQLLIEWNATEAEYPSDVCIHELFELQVAASPEATALICESEELSYRELNQRANQLAHLLQALGVRPETRVGIYMERSIEMVVAVLGVLKAGGAYVPLDPAYPKDRLTYMVHDAGLKVLLSHQELGGGPLEKGVRVIYLDRDWRVVCGESEQNLGVRITPENLAYVIYTSGSTGRPRGVMGLHRGAVNRFAWMWKAYPFEPGEVCCARTSLSFVDSVWEIFGPLLDGIRTVLIPDDNLKDVHALVKTLAAYHVTRLVVVPSLLRAMLESCRDLGRRLPELKYWVTSGEALPVDLYYNFRKSMPQSVLINLYGSSEVAADVTCFETSDAASYHSVPIGRPISNTQTYVVDGRLQLVPVGVPGELLIGGAGLARGYNNLPELTAEKFVPSPFSNEPSARVYKTGDLVRYLPDSNIEFLGRVDQQVKIRGFRVECEEVNAVLCAHPDVQEVAVLLREDRPGDRRLVAYVVPQRGRAPTDAALHLYLREQLPEYMIPSAFVLLDRLPLTPNGKLDRQALPAPSEARSGLEKTYIAPRTALEEVLISMYAEVLASRVGIDDNFFSDLGGHSLLATQLVSRIRDTFQIELPLRTVFDKPTVRELSEELLEDSSRRSRVERTAELLLTMSECSDDEIEARLLQMKLSASAAG